MGKYEEVLPDSQDEAEMDIFDLFGGELSPLRERTPSLINASIPSPQTSSSFVLPQQMATSTISQYTTDTVPKTVPDKASSISAFTTPSSRKLSSKPRPKPRPNYVGTNDATIQVHVDPIGNIESLSAAGKTQPPPLPESTFTADISERIKARRALAKQTQETVGNKSSCDDKKSASAVEEIIEISSDMTPSPSRPTSSRHPRKQRSKPQSVSSLGFAAPGLGQSSPYDEVGGRNASPAISRKRKREHSPDNDTFTLSAPIITGRTSNNLGSETGQDAAPLSKPKKKNKDNHDLGDTGKTDKTKRKGKELQPKKRPTKPKPMDKEKDQFKSSEFILDSDDELALGNREDVDIGSITTAAEPPVIPKSPRPEASDESMREPSRMDDLGHGPSEGFKQSASQKRKATSETQDKADGRPPSKKPRCSEDNAKTHIVKEKPAVTLYLSSDTSATTKNDIQKTRKKKGGRKVIVDEEEEDGKVKIKPSQKAISSSKPPHTTNTPESRVDMSETENDIPKTNRKKGGKKVIEDQEDVGTKENIDPLPKPPSTTTPACVTKVLQRVDSSFKSFYPHPPKNQPLSAILQRVNGSSPRPRASPSISRNLLTRIAPLHPNRRTPPPPPPPRIIPKKTKKELEREEKWEEELQETVEGWCELEEAERERLRKQKRDWELGLYEE